MAEEEEEEEVQAEDRQATAWTKSSSIHHRGRVRKKISALSGSSSVEVATFYSTLDGAPLA
jgi:hypothetical protein